jgi:hypothetical protein
VLHKIPPVSSGLRQREGYRRLQDEDGVDEAANAPTRGDDYNVPDIREESLREADWSPLLWSFSASALMTVISDRFVTITNEPNSLHS